MQCIVERPMPTRLQRQAAIDAELTKATSEPIKDKPGMKPGDNAHVW